MSRPSECYAQALLELGISVEAIRQAHQVWNATPLLEQMLCNPTVTAAEKKAVLEKIMPKELLAFFCQLCGNAEAALAPEIFQSFYEKERKQRNCILAVVEYVTPLTQKQQEGLKAYAKKISGADCVELELQENQALMGGFILHVEDNVYDRSVRSTINALRNTLAGQR